MDEYVLSLSYGKDSMACLGAIKELGWPLTRIVHAEIWATDTIPADLPPMVEFKKKADKWIKDNFGIDVEHVCARRPLSGAERERERESLLLNFLLKDSSTRTWSVINTESPEFMDGLSNAGLGVIVDLKQDPKMTFERGFYQVMGAKSKKCGQILGWPMVKGNWCNRLKTANFIIAP